MIKRKSHSRNKIIAEHGQFLVDRINNSKYKNHYDWFINLFTRNGLFDKDYQRYITRLSNNNHVNGFLFCFACGLGGNLEKAHIKPINLGGEDEVCNIHLLCPNCHKESEILINDKYEKWMNNKKFGDNIAKWKCEQEMIKKNKFEEENKNNIFYKKYYNLPKSFEIISLNSNEMVIRKTINTGYIKINIQYDENIESFSYLFLLLTNEYYKVCPILKLNDNKLYNLDEINKIIDLIKKLK